MSQHAGHTGNRADIGDLRKCQFRQKHRQYTFTNIVDTNQYTCAPAHQDRRVGGSRITASVFQIHIPQLGKINCHIRTAHQISQYSHNQVTHRHHPFFSDIITYNRLHEKTYYAN